MGDQGVEREFMGKGRSRIWTYLILMIVLVAIVVAINLVWKSPEDIRRAWKAGRTFKPKMSAEERERHLAKWRRAVERA